MVARYTPADFAYNGRVAAALLPCLATVSVLGGQSVFIVLALGGVLGFSMDLMGYRDGAFSAAWVTMMVTACAFSISMFSNASAHVWIQVALIFTVLITCLSCSVWASVQFKYFQLKNPAVTLAFERFIITASMPIAAILHTVGLSLLVDASDLPFYTAVELCVLYALFGVPLPSSFISTRSTGAVMGGGSPISAAGTSSAARRAARDTALSRGAGIQSRFDAFILALTTCAVPPLLYLAVHWEVLFRHILHLHSVLLLASLPMLVLVLVPYGMWWVPGGPRLRKAIKGAIMVTGLVLAVIGFEGRVVFHSYSQYVKLPPPWNWVAVTAAMLGAAAVILAAQQGVLGGTLDVTVAGGALLLCTAAGSLATGVPFPWLPAPLIAASGLALFFDSRNLREYTVFVGGAFMTGVWFVLQHFWLLDIRVGGVHLHMLCRVALAALLPALMIPGLVYAAVPAPAVDALVMLQSMLLTILEERLYVPSHSDWAGEPMYPGWLVVATSGLGLAATRHLAARHHITSLGSWVGHGVYVSKLLMLLIPEASLVLPAILLVLTATVPLFLTPKASASASGAVSASLVRRRGRIPPWLGLLQATSVLCSLGLSRFAVFDVVQFLLSSRPPEGLLLGCLLLAAAACLAPLVITHYSLNQPVRRALSCVVLLGVLLVVLQPPLPLRGGAACPKLPLALCPRLWDERHIPLHSSEDAEIWGSGLGRKEHWPRWLLAAALVLGVGAGALGGPSGASASAASGRSGPNGARSSMSGGQGATGAALLRRLALVLVTGMLVGGYVALEVVPGQTVLQVLVFIACMLVVGFVLLLPLPNMRGPFTLPSIALTWFITLGLTMLLQAELPSPEPPADMKRLFPDTRLQVEDELQAATRAALVAVAACQAAIMALALKLHVVSTLKAQDSKMTAENGHSVEFNLASFGLGPRGSELFCSIVPLQAFSRWGQLLKLDAGGCGALMTRLGGVGLAWAPSLGNMCAASAYAMCVSLNVQVTGGNPEALFMAAPLLLLLQQDPVMAAGLTTARRYVPLFTATAASLFLTCVTASYESIFDSDPSQAGAVASRGAVIKLPASSPGVAFMQSVVCAALTLPAAWVLTSALWQSKPLSLATHLWTGLLCILTPLLTAQPAALYSTGMILLSSLVHHASLKHNKRMDAKVI